MNRSNGESGVVSVWWRRLLLVVFVVPSFVVIEKVGGGGGGGVMASSSVAASASAATPSTATESNIVGRRRHGINNPAAAVWRRGRRWLNFGSLLGSPTAANPYERIAGHAVFAVTTPWGSPYLNMERLDDLDEVVQEQTQSNRNNNNNNNNSNSNNNRRGGSGGSISEEQNEYRTVCLYFMDPDDATAVHGEMKQMDNMASADLRITSFSLAKAVRQAANFGHGLPTGQPPEPTTGRLPDAQGALRYKIVPPKRQLYYAARCVGRERVGLWGDSPAQDAQTALLGNGALEAENLVRRRTKRERKTVPHRTALQAKNAHMEGYTGIPVFYQPRLQRRVPFLKRVLSGNHREIPLFFNYEDMVTAYGEVRNRAGKKTKDTMPMEMPPAEVFNLWDVLTSMDRAYSGGRNKWITMIQRRFGGLGGKSSTNAPPQLTEITFVPNSRATRYKEAISKRGNGKARLRPMR